MVASRHFCASSGCHLPPGFDRRLAIDFVPTGRVQRAGAGIDQVDHAASGYTAQLVTGDTLDRSRAPVGAHIGKDLGGVGQQVAKEHGSAVQAVVFGSHDVWLAQTVPIEGRIQDRLHEIAVGLEVGPLALALETGQDGVMSQGFLAKAELSQARVANHQVAGDHRHLDDFFPILVLLRPAALVMWRVVFATFLAVGFHPG